MQQINKRVLMSAVALLLVCGVSLSSGSAFAHGSDDSTSTDTSDSTSRTQVKVETENEQEHATEVENHTHDLTEQFRQQGQAKVQAESKDHAKLHTEAERGKSCSARKDALTKRMANAVAAAQRHKDTFDSIYAKVKAFHDTKGLNTTDYASLVTATDSAQADATAKIAALKALNVTVDCTQVNSLATNLSAFREAVGSTRDSLKAYRKALVTFTKAVHDSAKTTTDDSSTTNSTVQ
jgi:hypothetical protein